MRTTIFRNPTDLIFYFLINLSAFFPLNFQGRDVFIAYVLVAITYSLVGFLFYLTFPLKKSCIEQVRVSIVK